MFEKKEGKHMGMKEKMDPVYAKLKAPDFKEYETFRSRDDIDFFGWADPFFPDPSVPDVVKQGIIQSLNTNAAHYTLPVGDIKMREAVAKRVKEINGIEVDPNKNIVITSGSDISFNYAMRPFLIPGEENEVMMPTPSYAHNFTTPELMGGKAVPVPTFREDGYDLRIEEFEKLVTPKTKIVAITNPNNPTTTVYSKETLLQLADFVKRHDLVLFIDQCFEDIIFDGYDMHNIIAMPGMFERTILVSSFSKGMGLCGMRLAYIVAHEDIMGVLHACAINYIGAPNTMVQYGILAALDKPDFMKEIRDEFQARALKSYELMKDIPNVYCHKPESGFFLWLEIEKLGDPDEICNYLMEDNKVAVSSGNIFGPLGTKGIRIIIGAKRSYEECINVVKRIRQSLLRHPKNIK